MADDGTPRPDNRPLTHAALLQHNVQLREQLAQLRAQQVEQLREREQLAKLRAQQVDQLRELEEEIDQLERSYASSHESEVGRVLLEAKKLERSRLEGNIQGLEAVLASANRHEPPGDVTVRESDQPSSSVSGSGSVPSNRADTGGTVAGSPVTLRTETTAGTGSLPGDGPGMQE